MTNKSMVSVPRELLEGLCEADKNISALEMSVFDAAIETLESGYSELRLILDAPAEDVRAVVDEPVALRAFANDMISAAYEGGSFDGGDIQDIAVKYGLLGIEQRIEACGEHCACSEYGFPAECYRRTDLLKTSQ